MLYLTKHVRVDSKMGDVIKPAQKNNNFEVHLSNPIYLNEVAKIALADISFPNRINSIHILQERGWRASYCSSVLP